MSPSELKVCNMSCPLLPGIRKTRISKHGSVIRSRCGRGASTGSLVLNVIICPSMRRRGLRVDQAFAIVERRYLNACGINVYSEFPRILKVPGYIANSCPQLKWTGLFFQWFQDKFPCAQEPCVSSGKGDHVLKAIDQSLWSWNDCVGLAKDELL